MRARTPDDQPCAVSTARVPDAVAGPLLTALSQRRRRAPVSPSPRGWSWGAEHLVVLGQAPFLSAPALNAGNSAWAKDHEGLGLQGSLERRARGIRGSTRAWGSGRGWRPLSWLSAACCHGTPPQSPLACIKQGYIRNTSTCRTAWVSVHSRTFP